MSHETKGQSDEWYTPKYIFDALGVKFDLDVAHPKDHKTHVPAVEFIYANSLQRDWYNFIWMNPPYGNEKEKIKWIKKFIDHGNGIALMPDRTNATWWQIFAENSDAHLFTFDKIKFERPDGSIGESPSNNSTFFAIGEKGLQALENARDNKLGLIYTKYRKS
jgi:hypothetical protein